MNYIYNINLNFNKDLYDFFDWNKTDNLVHIKIIPIFKVTKECIKDFFSNEFNLDKNCFSLIQNKCTIWNKNNKHKNYALFSDENNIIGIEFDNNGKSISKSSLPIEDELEILENIHKFQQKKFKYTILKKNIIKFKTRKQEKEDCFILNELKNIDDAKLNYLFFECFGKHEKNKKQIINKLLNLSKNSKTYKNLYNILKFTSTTNK